MVLEGGCFSVASGGFSRPVRERAVGRTVAWGMARAPARRSGGLAGSAPVIVS